MDDTEFMLSPILQFFYFNLHSRSSSKQICTLTVSTLIPTYFYTTTCQQLPLQKAKQRTHQFSIRKYAHLFQKLCSYIDTGGLCYLQVWHSKILVSAGAKMPPPPSPLVRSRSFWSPEARVLCGCQNEAWNSLKSTLEVSFKQLQDSFWGPQRLQVTHAASADFRKLLDETRVQLWSGSEWGQGQKPVWTFTVFLIHGGSKNGLITYQYFQYL